MWRDSMIPHTCRNSFVIFQTVSGVWGRGNAGQAPVGMYQLRMRFDGRFADPLLGQVLPLTVPARGSSKAGGDSSSGTPPLRRITRHSGASRDVSLFFSQRASPPERSASAHRKIEIAVRKRLIAQREVPPFLVIRDEAARTHRISQNPAVGTRLRADLAVLSRLR